MKLNESIVCIIACCLCAAACQKSGAGLFSGSYTYKTSGSLGLVPASGVETSDTTVLPIVTEQGQMNIAGSGEQDRVMVAWNDMTGDACHTMASVSGTELVLEPFTKNMSVKTDLLQAEAVVTCSGTGKLYDNMLVISLEYSGTLTLEETSIKIVASNVECIAKAN